MVIHFFYLCLGSWNTSSKEDLKELFAAGTCHEIKMGKPMDEEQVIEFIVLYIFYVRITQ